jgi:enamine deaminase RidA (YjgF/YER057c/UK114 family)
MSAEARLAELGIDLPGRFPAAGNYLPAKRHGDTLYVSGHGGLSLDGLETARVGADGFITVESATAALVRGKVGGEISLEQAVGVARATGLLMLSTIRAELGSLDRVRSIVKVLGMVNCAPGFNQTPAVIDGCSDLLVEVFGPEIGRHARSAVGMAELPFDIPVEIELVAAVA